MGRYIEVRGENLKRKMPKLQPKFFSVKKAPKPNGRCSYYISGFPAGKRELHWFRTEKEAKQAKEDKNTELAATVTVPP
jgi:hypothetical protein